MKTMKWLLRRELWEHKGALLWAPVVVGSLMVAFVGSMIAYAVSQGKFGDSLTVNGKPADMQMMVDNIPPEKLQQIAEAVSSAYMAAAAPLFLMMAVITFFYCLGALFEERRDRSILFWKSLPVSDAHTVLAKVLTVALVAPLITIGVGMFVSVLLLLIVGLVAAFHGVNMFGLVLSQGEFYLTPLRMVALLPVYFIWALPTIGWLMMVSAWARSKVFLWAVGAPLITMVIVKWADFILGLRLDLDWLFQNVLLRGLVGLLPGNWMQLAKIDPHQMVNENNTMVLRDVFNLSWGTVATMPALLGALAGAAMIFAAIRLRRWKDEG